MKLNIYIWLIIIELNFITIRATASAVVKSCIIQIVHHFAHFNPKNAHISQCKSVQICTIVTITVHICTATLALPFNILAFVSLPSLYLWFTSFSFSRFLSRLTLTDQLSHFIKSTLSFQQTNSLADPRRRPKPHRRSIGCFLFSFSGFLVDFGCGSLGWLACWSACFFWFFASILISWFCLGRGVDLSDQLSHFTWLGWMTVCGCVGFVSEMTMCGCVGSVREMSVKKMNILLNKCVK